MYDYLLVYNTCPPCDFAQPSTPTEDDSKSKRTRVPVQPYQSPMADLYVPKVKTPAKVAVEKKVKEEKDIDKEKLVIFYKYDMDQC